MKGSIVHGSLWKNILFCWTKWCRSLICRWKSCQCFKLCFIKNIVFFLCVFILFFSQGSSLITHNREDRGLVRQKSSYFQTDVEYEATLDQISALIDISSHCQQLLSYECHNSVFFWYGVNNPFQHVAFWKHGISAVHYNYGGVDSGLQGCPCGLTGSKCYTKLE